MKRSFIGLLTIIFVSVGIAQLQAQSPPDSKQSAVPYIFRSEAKEVLVDVVVLDPKNNPKSGLKKKDFRILDDGVETPVLGLWSNKQDMYYVLAVDRTENRNHTAEAIRQTEQI